MFAPVAARFQTYDVSLDGQAAVYMGQLLYHPLVVGWFAHGEAESLTIDAFELPAQP
jgi:glutathione S-transferase